MCYYCYKFLKLKKKTEVTLYIHFSFFYLQDCIFLVRLNLAPVSVSSSSETRGACTRSGGGSGGQDSLCCLGLETWFISSQGPGRWCSLMGSQTASEPKEKVTSARKQCSVSLWVSHGHAELFPCTGFSRTRTFGPLKKALVCSFCWLGSTYSWESGDNCMETTIKNDLKRYWLSFCCLCCKKPHPHTKDLKITHKPTKQKLLLNFYFCALAIFVHLKNPTNQRLALLTFRYHYFFWNKCVIVLPAASSPPCSKLAGAFPPGTAFHISSGRYLVVYWMYYNNGK